MANLFTSPRSRAVVYTPEIPPDWFKPEDVQKSKFRSALTNTAKRLVSDNTPPVINKFLSANSYTFPGVQSAKWTYARDVSEQYGLQRFTLLPWYTKAIRVNITGKYYIGAFLQDTVTNLVSQVVASVPKLDALVAKSLFQRVKDELQTLDNKILTARQIENRGRSGADLTATTLLSALRVGEHGDSDSLSLFGFITSFSITESVASPFVQDYTLEYLGVDREWYNSRRADSMYTVDSSQL